MIIYHGSDIVVKEPKILESNRLLDFGIGFYTTSNREQALRWAKKVSDRNGSDRIILSKYKFNYDKAKKDLIILEFSEPDEKWLDFVLENRTNKDFNQEYDIVIGPVADDNVYATVKLFEAGILNIDETIKRLKIQQLFNQILFHTESALTFCDFIEIEEEEA
ncbi:DUF3990 domain-containing protein [Aminipila sp.]|uniref:DUF3990 domain-containing protein n=1 Tax=Aminipila sp. TaxID=2060095 RepID=UPI0028A12C80|nr:DUF3990 domain-containing protein [Aminipila sp.]